MVNPNRQQQATRHEFRARNYRRQAESLLERDNDLDCASALIYESAKQCINALANQQGLNPTRTGEKERFLIGIAQREDISDALISLWKLTDQLHIYADREHLNQQDYMEAWAGSLTFIDNMLAIYAVNQ